jgi:hypothetical protein
MGQVVSKGSSSIAFGSIFIMLFLLTLFFVLLWRVSGSPFSSKVPPDLSPRDALNSFWMLVVAWGVLIPLVVITFLWGVFFTLLSFITGTFSGKPSQPAVR